MAWYDFFANFYDRSLDGLYRDARAAALQALAPAPGQRVLDLPTGTGPSTEGLARAVGPTGRVIGVDLSRGMLRRATARATRLRDDPALAPIELLHGDVHALTPELTGGPVDAVHVFLGMSTFPRPDDAFERLWATLRPGGRCVVVDVFAAKLGFQGRMVNLIARADIRRRSWEPLERVATDFTRTDLPSRRQHGGTLFLAVGVKPG